MSFFGLFFQLECFVTEEGSYFVPPPDELFFTLGARTSTTRHMILEHDGSALVHLSVGVFVSWQEEKERRRWATGVEGARTSATGIQFSMI